MSVKLQVAYSSNLSVLILGRTGSGKTYLAKKIHRKSKLSTKPFYEVNVCALSESLFESEMFGHKKGAFTGADRDKKGFCEVAEGCTLFLDEIGDLSLNVQAKLLTLLDKGTYYRVGETTPRRFNGRLIFATNKNLKSLVEKNEFREDLYYRLKTLELKLDCLADKPNKRKIIWEFIQSFRLRNNLMNKDLEYSLYEKLYEHSWPGNYRELANTIEFLFSVDLKVIPSHLFKLESDMFIDDKYEKTDSYHVNMEKYEKSLLIKYMNKFEGKINYTSEMIGLNKVTLISKLKKYDIDRSLYINNKYTKKVSNGL